MNAHNKCFKRYENPNEKNKKNIKWEYILFTSMDEDCIHLFPKRRTRKRHAAHAYPVTSELFFHQPHFVISVLNSSGNRSQQQQQACRKERGTKNKKQNWMVCFVIQAIPLVLIVWHELSSFNVHDWLPCCLRCVVILHIHRRGEKNASPRWKLLDYVMTNLLSNTTQMFSHLNYTKM